MRAAAIIPIPCARPKSSRACGGDGITAHLREDRRHIRDDDLQRIQDATDLPLNLEMAATEEMLAIALPTSRTPPASCPKSARSAPPRAGSTPPGLHNQLAPIVTRLTDAGIRVSLFIEANERQLEAALRLGAPVVEFHTGEYAHAASMAIASAWQRN